MQFYAFFLNTYFGPNWTDSRLFRHISDQIGPDWAESELEKKKKFVMDARAGTSTATRRICACWTWVRRPWRRTHASQLPNASGSIPFNPPLYLLLIDHLTK